MAPTLGKFYVKLSKRDNHLLWGNFTVRYADNELALVERGLYGANARYQSLDTTRFGERRIAIDGFAADPGTVSSREEFRGTGGSVYFLNRRDLLVGSERLRVEVRDKASGLVSEVIRLQPELDYDIDYIQGRVLLSEPLSAIADDSLLVRNDGLSGNEVWLVVQYEFTPGFEEVDALNLGGQGHYWLSDFVKLGVTANRNEEDGVDNSLYAADLTFRKNTRTWLKIQAGRTEGLVSTSQISGDGGFTFDEVGEAGFRVDDAYGYRVDLSIGFADVLEGAGGQISLYGQRLEAGYSAPGLNARSDTDQYGGLLQMPILDSLDLTAKAD
ncbi:MAG TPA: flagellar motor protein MotB, partial [Myxococcota bacterium]|nr:flagellar motor protein MotB [Myxococcota bacterium]